MLWRSLLLSLMVLSFKASSCDIDLGRSRLLQVWGAPPLTYDSGIVWYGNIKVAPAELWKIATDKYPFNFIFTYDTLKRGKNIEDSTLICEQAHHCYLFPLRCLGWRGDSATRYCLLRIDYVKNYKFVTFKNPKYLVVFVDFYGTWDHDPGDANLSGCKRLLFDSTLTLLHQDMHDPHVRDARPGYGCTTTYVSDNVTQMSAYTHFKDSIMIWTISVDPKSDTSEMTFSMIKSLSVLQKNVRTKTVVRKRELFNLQGKRLQPSKVGNQFYPVYHD